jgi:GTP diphosphokinase / guanosine-3',5'-bis(diphosphate) 3'-diphosphatase
LKKAKAPSALAAQAEQPPMHGFTSMAVRSDPKRVASINTLLSLCDYLDANDIQRLKEAYRLSDNAHLGQIRTSGEPYISHPIAVAEICARWRLDGDALMAALLHDVVEDCGVPLTNIVEQFGSSVAAMVDGLSKLDRAEFASKEVAQAENFRKMLLAMSRDVRVILIKLADRLHNMQTLDAVPRSKQQRVANETLAIYAPIADRLGLSELQRELTDLSFKFQSPFRFRVLEQAVLAEKRSNRHLYKRILNALEVELNRFSIEAAIESREKTLYGIYKKMQSKHQPFAAVMDVYGFRLVVADLSDCYLALGAIHAAFRPISERFKDYIANPKTNGYQSIHTTVVGPHGTPVEFQIRTRAMHRTAEAGIAAHWLYKAKEETFSELQTRTHRWLQGLLDIQNSTRDSLEFLEHVKVDLFPDAIYVFTPKGMIRALPKHATALDFAYGIHTDVGNRSSHAKVNGAEVPLRTELNHGDVVEIVTQTDGTPNAQWLQFARTGKARSEIRHFLRTTQFAESLALGKQLLEQALASIRIDAAHVQTNHFDKAIQDAGAATLDELYAEIGLGKILAPIVARSIAKHLDPEGEWSTRTAAKLPVFIRGTEGMTVQFAKCCLPIPGDEITGQMAGGHGLNLHRVDCSSGKRLRERDPDRWIDVAWSKEVQGMFRCRIEAFVMNESGLLSRVTGEIAGADSNIVDVQMENDAEGAATLRFMVEVHNRDHLARIMRMLRRVPGVKRIERL